MFVEYFTSLDKMLFRCYMSRFIDDGTHITLLNIHYVNGNLSFYYFFTVEPY